MLLKEIMGLFPISTKSSASVTTVALVPAEDFLSWIVLKAHCADSVLQAPMQLPAEGATLSDLVTYGPKTCPHFNFLFWAQKKQLISSFSL